MKKRLITIIAFALAVLMPLSATSCSSASASGLSGKYTRNQEDEGAVTEDFTEAASKFAFDLFHATLTEDGKNDLISPLSAMLCLALVTNGAEGETLAQLENALGMKRDDLNRALYAYSASLYNEEEQVHIANSIWFRDTDSLTVGEDFLQRNADWFGADVYKKPFDSSTVKEINGWVKENTKDMIDSILDSIDPSAVMYLMNALAFDAKWQWGYDKHDVIESDFNNADGTTSHVDMMYSTEMIYLSGSGAEGFVKNYSGAGFSFVGLLPKNGTDAYALARKLDGDAWLDLWNSRETTEVRAAIPEFSYEIESPLNDALMSLGIEDLFSPFDADLSSLGKSTMGNLYCSSVRQKTFIDVGSEGTKAAAVTIIEVYNTCAESPALKQPKRVILDRPFVYAIVDNTTGLPLFLGVVETVNG